MFIRHDGRTKLISVPTTLSQNYTSGGLIAYTAGLAVMATSGSTAVQIGGVARQTFTNGASTTANVLVEIPLDKNVEWEADTSSATTTDQGTEVDLTDCSTINRGASSIKAAFVRLVPRTDGTKVIVLLKLNGSY